MKMNYKREGSQGSWGGSKGGKRGGESGEVIFKYIFGVQKKHQKYNFTSKYDVCDDCDT